AALDQGPQAAAAGAVDGLRGGGQRLVGEHPDDEAVGGGGDGCGRVQREFEGHGVFMVLLECGWPRGSERRVKPGTSMAGMNESSQVPGSVPYNCPFTMRPEAAWRCG